MDYERQIIEEVKSWQNNMIKDPKLTSVFAKGIQNKINNIVPEKAHIVITETIKNMTKIVLKGSEFISKKPYLQLSLKEREYLLEEKFKAYRKTATLTGAGIGVGGVMLGLADLPSLMTIKIKFLFDVACLYGYDVRDFKERLFILYIFKLAFSSDEKRKEVYYDIEKWDSFKLSFPDNFNDFDWRGFQQEYRDYMDISKMLQLIPVVGAVFGATANYKLLNRLFYISKNSYRLRVLKDKNILIK